MENLTFGALLRQERKRKHLTKTQLAQQTGISLMSITRYEADQTTPNLDKATAIAIALNCHQLIELSVHTSTPHQLKDRLSSNDAGIDVILHKTFIDAAINHDVNILPYLTTYAQILSHINETGREQIDQLMKALSKVPDYQQD